MPNPLDREIEIEALKLRAIIARTGMQLGFADAAAFECRCLLQDLLDLYKAIPEHEIPRARAALVLCRLADPSTGISEGIAAKALAGALARLARGEGQRG